jgi:NAD(P)H-dependent FMN reductase
MTQTLKIAIIIGSTRPNRIGEGIARWVFEVAKKRTEAEFELVDIRDYHLPILDEPHSASLQKYLKQHTKLWSEKISSFDGFVFVTPEYNHGTSGALKNALDFLYKEWNNKAAGFVSYGGSGGLRAVEQLRIILAALQIAHVKSQLALFLGRDFENKKILIPTEKHEKYLNTMLNQLIKWTTAMATIRRK